ncbi:hypothetical protein CGZ80_12375 [Rhodopirellula sp. MGV]|nr:hypothetical protein CGZ80_12375 [Rhodopirellula sp. MGV]PNY37798.1 hypothetical protein C2E31_05925 [Rhodopirellula baltica]
MEVGGADQAMLPRSRRSAAVDPQGGENDKIVVIRRSITQKAFFAAASETENQTYSEKHHP